MSIFALTVDRYVAVKYALRYQNIVTIARLFVLLTSIWLSSVILAVTPQLIVLSSSNADLTADFYEKCIHMPLYLIISVVSVLLSFWIRRIRDQHVADIKKRNHYFGVEAEKLNVLQNLATAVWDVIKLNFVNAFLMVLANVLTIVHAYCFNGQNVTIFAMLGLTRSLYALSNPIVYALTMTELKQQYVKLIKCNVVSVIENSF